MLPDPLDAPSFASRKRVGYNSKRIKEHNHSFFSLGILWTSSCSSLCLGSGNHKDNLKVFFCLLLLLLTYLLTYLPFVL